MPERFPIDDHAAIDGGPEMREWDGLCMECARPLDHHAPRYLRVLRTLTFRRRSRTSRRGRIDLMRLALLDRGSSDDNLSVGWWLPEWMTGRLPDRPYLPRTWKAFLLLKLLVALLIGRERDWGWEFDEWVAATFDGDSYGSQEGTVYTWSELRVPTGLRRWTYCHNREST